MNDRMLLMKIFFDLFSRFEAGRAFWAKIFIRYLKISLKNQASVLSRYSNLYQAMSIDAMRKNSMMRIFLRLVMMIILMTMQRCINM